VHANIKEKSIEDIWKGNDRKEALENIRETLCVECIYGVRDTENNIITRKVI
jgi:hypothetical protein